MAAEQEKVQEDLEVLEAELMAEMELGVVMFRLVEHKRLLEVEEIVMLVFQDLVMVEMPLVEVVRREHMEPVLAEAAGKEAEQKDTKVEMIAGHKEEVALDKSEGYLAEPGLMAHAPGMEMLEKNLFD